MTLRKHVLVIIRQIWSREIELHRALLFCLGYAAFLFFLGWGAYVYFLSPYETRPALERRLELSREQAQGEAGKAAAAVDYGWTLYQKYLQTGESEYLAQARQQYEEALKADPDNAAAKYNLALLCDEEDKTDQAVALLKEVVAAQPRHYLAHYLLGRLYTERGDYPEAVKELQQTLSLMPGLANVYAELGSVYEKQGRAEMAVEAYRQALRYNPSDGLARKRLDALGLPSGDTR